MRISRLCSSQVAQKDQPRTAIKTNRMRTRGNLAGLRVALATQHLPDLLGHDLPLADQDAPRLDLPDDRTDGGDRLLPEMRRHGFVREKRRLQDRVQDLVGHVPVRLGQGSHRQILPDQRVPVRLRGETPGHAPAHCGRGLQDRLPSGLRKARQQGGQALRKLGPGVGIAEPLQLPLDPASGPLVLHPDGGDLLPRLGAELFRRLPIDVPLRADREVRPGSGKTDPVVVRLVEKLPGQQEQQDGAEAHPQPKGPVSPSVRIVPPKASQKKVERFRRRATVLAAHSPRRPSRSSARWDAGSRPGGRGGRRRSPRPPPGSPPRAGARRPSPRAGQPA